MTTKVHVADLPFSFIALASRLRMSDSEVADILGMPKSSVQAIRTGRYKENLTDEQIEKLVSKALSIKEDAEVILDQMEFLR